jgi:hypothetical protein
MGKPILDMNVHSPDSTSTKNDSPLVNTTTHPTSQPVTVAVVVVEPVTENPDVATTENPDAATAENLEAATAENPDTATAENLEAATAENPDTATAENLEADATKNPSLWVSASTTSKLERVETTKTKTNTRTTTASAQQDTSCTQTPSASCGVDDDENDDSTPVGMEVYQHLAQVQSMFDKTREKVTAVRNAIANAGPLKPPHTEEELKELQKKLDSALALFNNAKEKLDAAKEILAATKANAEHAMNVCAQQMGIATQETPSRSSPHTVIELQEQLVAAFKLFGESKNDLAAARKVLDTTTEDIRFVKHANQQFAKYANELQSAVDNDDKKRSTVKRKHDGVDEGDRRPLKKMRRGLVQEVRDNIWKSQATVSSFFKLANNGLKDTVYHYDSCEPLLRDMMENIRCDEANGVVVTGSYPVDLVAVLSFWEAAFSCDATGFMKRFLEGLSDTPTDNELYHVVHETFTKLVDIHTRVDSTATLTSLTEKWKDPDVFGSIQTRMSVLVDMFDNKDLDPLRFYGVNHVEKHVEILRRLCTSASATAPV